MKLNELVVEKVEDPSESETGTFVGVKFTKKSCDQLIDMMDKMGLKKPTPREDLHCTVMYSPKPIPDFVEDHPKPVTFSPPEKATIQKFHVFPSQEGENVLVLFLKSEFLQDRHKEIIDAYGAEYTHDKYLPHVTLMYSDDDFTLSDWNIEDYDASLEIDNEYNTPIDPEWK